MLFMWKPWATSTVDDETISVTGEATIKAAPDEFVFYPIYQFENSDKTAALNALTKKSEEVVAKLKELGVPENKIKTNSSGYDAGPLKMPENGSTYSLQLTATVDNQELAQKVQDYLLTTQPTGSVSPTPTFSEGKRKELEAQARELATKDARAKADATAKNLGFKVGKVKSVSDGSSAWTMSRGGGDTAISSKPAAEPSLSLNPGENELPYSISVVYYLR